MYIKIPTITTLREDRRQALQVLRVYVDNLNEQRQENIEQIRRRLESTAATECRCEYSPAS